MWLFATLVWESLICKIPGNLRLPNTFFSLSIFVDPFKIVVLNVARGYKKTHDRRYRPRVFSFRFPKQSYFSPPNRDIHFSEQLELQRTHQRGKNHVFAHLPAVNCDCMNIIYYIAAFVNDLRANSNCKFVTFV